MKTKLIWSWKHHILLTLLIIAAPGAYYGIMGYLADFRPFIDIMSTAEKDFIESLTLAGFVGGYIGSHLVPKKSEEKIEKIEN